MTESTEHQKAIQRAAKVQELGLSEVGNHAVQWAEIYAVREDRVFSMEEVRSIIAEQYGVNPNDLHPIDATLGEDGTVLAVSFELDPEKTYHYELKATITFPYSQNKSKVQGAEQNATQIEQTIIPETEMQSSDPTAPIKGIRQIVIYKNGVWTPEV
jgi:hypothetical protein